MAMPLHRLKMLDIQSAEEEAMVQTAINAKIQNSPAPALSEKFHVPDIKTGEEEAHWQAIVDAEREKLKPPSISMEQIIPDATQVADIEVVSEPSEPSELVVKRFCEHCDSKGVRHKKGCPTLTNGLQNTTQNTNQ